MSDAPRIECDRQSPILTVADIAAAVEFYTRKLGFSVGLHLGRPADDGGRESGSRCRCSSTQGTPNPEGCSVYFVVGDADELYEFHRANGVEIVEPLGRPGLRDARLLGPRSRTATSSASATTSTSVGPPIQIERVDVPVRLEKRLAALLHRSGRAQAHEPDQLSRGDPAPHLRAARRRRRQPAHQARRSATSRS